jgi:O-antigen ligase
VKTILHNTDDKNSEESTASRIAVWQAALEIISENFMTGTGTGDVKDALIKKYSEKGMSFAREMKLNAHNQFIQTFAAVGVIGFIILLSSFFFTTLYAWKRKKYFYLIFLLLAFVNFTTESMLETQAGVVFYAFFNSVLLFTEEETP